MHVLSDKIIDVHVLVYILLSVSCICEGVECPTPGRHWIQRAANFCHNRTHYHCLKLRSRNCFKEICTRPVHFPPGTYPVLANHINGNYMLDAVRCPQGRFQNKFYFSNAPGLTYCPYNKTECTGPGQITIFTVTPSMDNTCRCNKDNGYKFLQPRDRIECSPSTENCECVKEKDTEDDKNHNTVILTSKPTRSTTSRQTSFRVFTTTNQINPAHSNQGGILIALTEVVILAVILVVILCN